MHAIVRDSGLPVSVRLFDCMCSHEMIENGKNELNLSRREELDMEKMDLTEQEKCQTET